MVQRQTPGGPSLLPTLLALAMTALFSLPAAHQVSAGLTQGPAISPAAPPGPPTDTRSHLDRWLWETQELVPQTELPPLRAISTSPFDWSPDGAVLAFAETNGSGSRLIAVSLARMRKYAIAETPRPITGLRWSPDSTSIAYHVAGEPGRGGRLVVMRLAREQTCPVAADTLLLSRLEWSPDSRRLAAVVIAQPGRGLAVWQVQDGSARQLCWLPGAALYWGDPVWSSDCNRIAARDAAGGFLILDVTSGEPATTLDTGMKAISVSPNLDHLVALSNGQAVIVEVPTRRHRPVLLDGVPAVPSEPYIDTGPVWFADSSAFALSQDGRLWVVDPATGHGRPLGPRQAPGYPRLERSGPGSGIAYQQGAEDPALNGLYLLSSPDGEPRLLLNGSSSGGIATIGSGWQWSPNGKWGTYRISTSVDPRDSSLGQYTWDLLLDVAASRLYHLTHEGWTPHRRMRRLFWSPTRSQALVWFDDGPRLLDLPG